MTVTPSCALWRTKVRQRAQSKKDDLPGAAISKLALPERVKRLYQELPQRYQNRRTVVAKICKPNFHGQILIDEFAEDNPFAHWILSRWHGQGRDASRTDEFQSLRLCR